MTILQSVLVLLILYCALRAPGKPNSIRESSRRPGDRVDD
jgi:hypothetical protein